MADKIPTYEKQILPPKKGPAVETPFSMDDAAKAQAYGAKTLEQSAESLYWLHKDLKQMAIKERKDKQAAEFAYTTANAKKRLAEEMLRIRTEKHYDEWAGEWEKAKAKVISEVMSGIKDPEVAKEVDKWFPSATIELDIDMMAETANMRMQEGRAQFADALQSAVNDGDMDTVKSLLNAMQHTTYWTPEQFKNIETTSLKETEKNQLTSLIMASPFGIDLDKVKTEYLDAEDIYSLKSKQETLQNRIEQERNDDEAEMIMQFIQGYYNGDPFPTPKQTEELTKQQYKDTPLPVLSKNGYMQMVRFFEAIQEGKKKTKIDPDVSRALTNQIASRIINIDPNEAPSLISEIEALKTAKRLTTKDASFLQKLVQGVSSGAVDFYKDDIKDITDNLNTLLDELESSGAINRNTRGVLERQIRSRIEFHLTNVEERIKKGIPLEEGQEGKLTEEIKPLSIIADTASIFRNAYKNGIIKLDKRTGFLGGFTGHTLGHDVKDTFINLFTTYGGMSKKQASQQATFLLDPKAFEAATATSAFVQFQEEGD